MLVDTHAHLYWESFKEDFDQVIQRAVDAGVTAIINVGVDVEKSMEALEQIEGLAKILNMSFYSTIGIHPEEVLRLVFDSEAKSLFAQIFDSETTQIRGTRRASLAQDKQSVGVSIQRDIEQLEKLYHSNTSRVVAVGECGLDFLFANNPWSPPSPTTVHPRKCAHLPGVEQAEQHDLHLGGVRYRGPSADKLKNLQRKLFQAQIDLAKKLNLPLLVHCRDDRSKDPKNSQAWNEVIKMVGNHPAILHCYSGLPSTTNLVLGSSNLIISFAGNITYPKNEYLREAVKITPLERIILETDCPFLPPQSKRGQRNEPANVLEVAKTIAEVKGVSMEEVARQTSENAKRVFRLSFIGDEARIDER